MHVGLTKGERIHVVLVVQVREAVVNEPVGRLVAPDGVQDIEELGVGLETPVVFGNLWRWEDLPVEINNVEMGYTRSWAKKPRTIPECGRTRGL